jgi:hypothetical protein
LIGGIDLVLLIVRFTLALFTGFGFSLKEDKITDEYNPFLDPQILQAVDGLELLSALAEKRSKSLDTNNKEVKEEEIKQEKTEEEIDEKTEEKIRPAQMPSRLLIINHLWNRNHVLSRNHLTL